MRIDSLNYTNKPQSSLNPINFKQGLTQSQINRVKNLGYLDYNNIAEKLKNWYGITANVGQSNVVAYCAEITAKIMLNAGFKLPKMFSFSPIPIREFGRYMGKNEEVIINSSYWDFLDLEAQNRLEENKPRNSASKHFLSTYLHEFSHCAHHKNIITKYGKDEAEWIFFTKFPCMPPSKIIVSPIKALIEKLFPEDCNNIINEVFDNNSELYEKDDLAEYFADKNDIALAKELGDNCLIGDIDSEFSLRYKGFPKDWKFDIKKINNPVEYFKQIIGYFDGEIWRGNVHRIFNAYLELK